MQLLYLSEVFFEMRKSRSRPSFRPSFRSAFDAADFKAALRSKRTLVADSALRGQVFSGKQAATQGLVTGLADSFNKALASF
jgi:hypothetical protein